MVLTLELDICQIAKYSYSFIRLCFDMVWDCLFLFLCDRLQFQCKKDDWKNISPIRDCILNHFKNTYKIVGNFLFGDFCLGNEFASAFVFTVAVDFDSQSHV